MTFMLRRAVSSTCATVLFGIVALAAQAQQNAPVTTPTPPTEAIAVPPISCEKPPSGPGIDPGSAQVKRFQKQIEDYKNCVNEYARAMGAKSNEYAARARAYAAAANGAIDQYNSFATELNAKAKAESGGK